MPLFDQKEYNRQLIVEFRANNSDAMNGRPLLLLTTTGAHSGQRHTTPLMFLVDTEHEERYFVLASNAGAAKAPDWYYNMLAHPAVTVEAKGATFETVAVIVAGDERSRLWAQAIQTAPFFVDHQAQINRQIPIVVLERPTP